jgi:hypothetical protein
VAIMQYYADLYYGTKSPPDLFLLYYINFVPRRSLGIIMDL